MPLNETPMKIFCVRHWDNVPCLLFLIDRLFLRIFKKTLRSVYTCI